MRIKEDRGLEKIRGTVDRIIFTSDNDQFCVFKATLAERSKKAVVAGNITTPLVGEEIEIKGYWWVHPRFGRQFKAESLTRILPRSEKGIVRYLSSGLFKGIGEAMARRIVETFGEDTLRIFEEEPERLREVRGIGAKTWQALMESYRDTEALHDLTLYLEQAGVSGRYAPMLHKTYGEDALEIIRENPYRLIREVDGIGFVTADQLACSEGLSELNESRIEAGLEHILLQATMNGDCCLPINKLVGKTAELLRVDQENITYLTEEMLDYGVFPVEIYEGICYVYHPRIYEAETGVAYHIERLLSRADAIPLPSDLVVKRIENDLQLKLAESQSEALRRSMSAGVVVITGGPGTGKTTLVRGILQYAEQANLKVLLAAPTGRAAKRLAEASGKDASTLHRLLEAGLDGEISLFQKDAANPLKGDVIIVDEASMLDIELMYHFLEAVSSGTRIVLVGDVNQLPPVGPGNVLRDIIDSDTVPVVHLKTIFRQASGSDIAVNAQRVCDGLMPEFTLDGDVVLYEFVDEKALEIVLQLCNELHYENDESKFSVQVLSPMYQGVCGVDNLNNEIQAQVQAADKKRGMFFVGDKVMQTRNNYEKGVYNGDIGLIFANDKDIAHVDYRDKNVTYENEERNEIRLAYAMTVHKSQGSEYDTVIIVLMPSQYIMLQRNLLYTALTRAKKKAYIVGTKDAIGKAVRTHYIEGRCGLLRARLCGEVDDGLA